MLTNVGDHHRMLRYAVAPVVPRAADALGLRRTLAAGAPEVAITFDDGPHPEGTPAVLELLARADRKATFFMIGEQVERRPELARRVLAEGHRVALHGYRHTLQLRMTAEQVSDDLERGAKVIEDAIGAGLDYHRPPYGIYSPAGLRSARARGLTPILWSRWGRDWRKYTTPSRIAARITGGLQPGDVILLHDADFYSSHNSHRRTVAALGLLITELNRRKLATVLVV